ncbi:MAG: hypothetical protein JWR85_1523 [Marmoricola sp.]|nr:hypothetical protein [Marmoricola sp.]
MTPSTGRTSEFDRPKVPRWGKMAAMSDEATVIVTLPADVHQIDQTGFVWAFLDEAREPGRVQPGSLIVAGDPEEPFLARPVDIVDGPGSRQIAHLDVVGDPRQVIDELRHARLLPP